MRIRVKTPSSDIVTVKVGPKTSMMNIKEQIYRSHRNYPIMSIRLFNQPEDGEKRLLADHETIAELKLEEGAELTMDFLETSCIPHRGKITAVLKQFVTPDTVTLRDISQQVPAIETELGLVKNKEYTFQLKDKMSRENTTPDIRIGFYPNPSKKPPQNFDKLDKCYLRGTYVEMDLKICKPKADDDLCFHLGIVMQQPITVYYADGSLNYKMTQQMSTPEQIYVNSENIVDCSHYSKFSGRRKSRSHKLSRSLKRSIRRSIRRSLRRELRKMK